MQPFKISSLAVPLVLGIAGLSLFLLWRADVSPKASVDLKISRSEAIAAAGKFLYSIGLPADGHSVEASFQMNAATQHFLVSQFGLRKANAVILADSLIIHRWMVYFYDAGASTSRMTNQYRVWLNQHGTVVGFNHIVQDSAQGAKLTLDSAQSVAEKFLGHVPEELGRYFLKRTSSINLAKRTDHTFIWASADSVAEARTEITVRIQGASVGMFSKEFVPPQSFVQWIAERFSSIAAVVIVSYILIFFLVIFIISIFLKKYHEGEVGVKSAVYVAATLFGLTALTMIVSYESIGFGVQLGDTNRTVVKLLLFGLILFVVYGFLSAMTFAAWSVGESSARYGWSKKLSGMDSLFQRKYFTANVGYSVVWGYGYGLALLGFITAVYYGMSHAGSDFIASNISLGGIPESYSPSVFAVSGAIVSAMISEITFRLFALSWLKEKIRSRWIGVAVSSFLWSFTAQTLWDIPFGTMYTVWQFPVLFAVGVMLSIVYLQYGILTSIITSSITTAIGIIEPVLFSTGGAYQIEIMLFGILFVLPLVIAVIGLFRDQEFQFTPDTTPSHIKRISERERMAKELEIARAVQMKLLPKENPKVLGFDIAGICLPAYEVGGDYYDFVILGDQKIGIAIGDVSGKGVPAAIYMTLTKGILQSHAEENVSPKSVLSKVNRLMYKTIEKNSFVSMFYAIIDLTSKSIRYSRAGHNPVILAGLRDEKHEFLTPKGVALGLDDGSVFDSVLEEREFDLRSGDILVFYTDGFTEARNEQGEEFTETRLLRSVAGAKERTAEEIINVVVRDAKKFSGDAEQHDDMTMVVVKVL